MKKRTIVYTVGAIALMLSTLVACGDVMGTYEEPRFDVVRSEKPFEIRDYAPALVAEAVTKGPRDEAISEGFRIIADFIFGNNISKSSIAMTTPVSQSSEKIAMTTPVSQSFEGEDNVWRVRFTMPSKYTLESLPKPVDERVQVSMTKPQRFAVIRFSGPTRDSYLLKQQAKLEAWVKHEKLTPISPASYHFYNPPWTVSFLRRNEVWIEIVKE
ncbi:MAG: heme-binding protein [Alphaproteobacteria bacterium]|nr:heme-binding protein [Alphaproteobacteria bacterium]